MHMNNKPKYKHVFYIFTYNNKKFHLKIVDTTFLNIASFAYDYN